MTLGLRLVLSATFVLAALGKLSDRPGTGRAIVGFGAPPAVAAPLAWLLPALELAAAALLLPEATAVSGAIAALVLLAVFSTAIAVNLARGRRPDCHCFGSLHSEPIGAGTLVRNGALAAAAVFVIAAGGGPSAVAWIELESFAAGLGLALVVAAAVSLELLRRYGKALRRIETLETGEGSLLGAPVTGVEDGLLVFTADGCGPCEQLKPRLEDWRDQLTITERDFDADRPLADAVGATATPAAVLIENGTIASDTAHGPAAIAELVEGFEPPPARVGDQAPEALPADGVVLFWNPDCGFCAQMRDAVNDMDGVVVVSTAPDDGLTAPVLLDPGRELAAAVGAHGTPIAIRVSEGRIASSPAVGRDAVLALVQPVKVTLTSPSGPG